MDEAYVIVDGETVNSGEGLVMGGGLADEKLLGYSLRWTDKNRYGLRIT